MKSTATAGSLLAADIDFFISGSPTPGLNSQRKNMFISSSGFIVTADGNVTASNIDLSGGLAAEGITATFGFFGDKLAVGGTEDVPNVIISASGEFSSSNFFVDKLGNVTASNMRLAGGLESETVQSNFGIFNSRIEVGGTKANARVVIGELEGHPLGGSSAKYGIRGFASNGTTRVFEISETRNELSGWTISDTSISKNNVKLDSTSNGEGLYVKKTSFSNTTAGAFIGLDSGTAKFNVGDNSKFIKFDGSDFTVDAGNFSLDSSGNMTATSATLTGTVTATAGAIGGFTITNGDITGSGGTFVTSGKTSDSGQDTTTRAELLPANFLVRADAGAVGGANGHDESHIVFDAVTAEAFNFFQGETSTKFRTVSTRMENAHFGKYDNSDSFTTGNLVIGKGGRTNASIRTETNDSNPDSMITPDTTNGGWVIGDALEIKNITAGFAASTRTNNSYTFSVVGTSYFSSTMTVAGGLVANGNVDLGNATSDTITFTGRIDSDVLPSTSAARDLGSSTLRWNNIYTTDMQLSNMDKEEGNEVDGTKGDWTIQEGKDDLFLINRLSGKKYRFKLEEMKDE